jgi:hypothetical protein
MGVGDDVEVAGGAVVFEFDHGVALVESSEIVGPVSGGARVGCTRGKGCWADK